MLRSAYGLATLYRNPPANPDAALQTGNPWGFTSHDTHWRNRVALGDYLPSTCFKPARKRWFSAVVPTLTRSHSGNP